MLSIRGEPAYRWLLRAAHYWRSPKLWSAEVVRTAEAEADKRLVSSRVVDRDDGSTDEEAAVRGSTTIGADELGAVESGADNGSTATSGFAGSSPPPLPAAHRSSMPEEST